MLKVKTKTRIILFALTAMVVFVMSGFTVHEIESAFHISNRNSAVMDNSVEHGLAKTDKSVPGTNKIIVPIIFHGRLAIWEPTEKYKTDVQIFLWLFVMFPLLVFIFQVRRLFYYIPAICKKRSLILAFPIGGNSPPQYATHNKADMDTAYSV